MRLATLRLPGGRTAAVRVEGATAVELPAADVGALLALPDWRERAAAGGTRHDLSEADPAPVVPRPGKIVCVGLNYRAHILEMGRELPAYPTLFAKYPEALIGARDDIVLPAASSAVDWEAELAVVVGATVRRADARAARAAIAGYTVLNDVTARDYQYRSAQWLQGKTFEATTPIGPVLVTPDELGGGDGGPALEITAELDGETVQRADTGDLVFGPADLVAYVSAILTLRPGDVIATGTPGGVGHARRPQRYLAPGSRLVTRIEGIGELVNTARAEGAGDA
ncbi:fumarylacetoacetate hydrolase family protein [Streptomonospora nanhaiensis]|uniref:Acylpyruvate hydrolase n=1 Tax=Streptomonospora nanhaiensis TaxID=1323731 RepID=A0A853BT77_9ACTN|nr:fumarylacetoacetate hydrolase family protein [Streptomonospora nanhaiensis]MBV2365416.1 fumarylacetoacetate hydrolase family protein [Streptomonospora nanhaiensis]MBX9390834.1 fumarylacetoacetate hydrolase family protein [Streptomonospora nanhaiensis]NYI98989.1 acylpyruvate hydrolase [Streptomonospora nanhaiensis]